MASCQNNPTKTPAIDLTNFDLSVAPNADFYQYATGGWQAKNPLKPEYSRYGAFDVIAENNQKRINDLFQEMAKIEAAPGSVEQKISDLYKMGLDSVRLNTEGAAPIQAKVAELLGITDRAQLTAAIADLHHSVANPFFGMGVQSDLMNSNMNALYISQSGLGMGTRDYYVDESNAGIKKAYGEMLAKLFTLTGIEQAEQAAASVVELETKLAEKMWSNVELRDIVAQYNPMSKADFEKTYDAIDWPAYYKAMGIGDFDTIIVTTPSAVANANDLLKNAPIESLRYYLAAQYINAAAGYLSDDFQQASFDFYGKVMSGQQEQKPRWKRAMSVPNGTLGEAVGEMYVAKYFPEKDKERMMELVKNLQTALGQHIDALDWMSDTTKAKAREKLATFTVKIGYPDKWKDYTTLKIDPAKSYWENIVEANAWYTSDNISKLGKPVDKDEWHMSPQTVNAYYNPTTNEICFPAAILQPPFYNPDADDAVNYGAIGVVIGHEMTHGFDDQGRQFDKDGNMNNWWTDEDAAADGLPQLARGQGDARPDRRIHARAALLPGLRNAVGPEHPRRGGCPSDQARRTLAGQVARERHAAQPADLLRRLRHHRRRDVPARGGARDHLVRKQAAGPAAAPRSEKREVRNPQRIPDLFFIRSAPFSAFFRPTCRFRSNGRSGMPETESTVNRRFLSGQRSHTRS